MQPNRSYLESLVWKMAASVAATEAAAFAVRSDIQIEHLKDHDLFLLCHIRPGDADESKRAAAIAAFRDIVKPCLMQGKDGMIEIDDTYDGKNRLYCLLIVERRNRDALAGAGAFITRCCSLKDAEEKLGVLQGFAVIGR